jgi:hypothetical protein
MNLFALHVSRDAWNRLTALKLPAQTAYRLLKYSRQVSAELELIEQQRNKLIRDCAGAKPDETVSLTPGSPEYAEFVEKFSSILETESDLKPADMKFEDLLGSMNGEKGNTLSTNDLAVLEPFFSGG